MSKKKKNKLIAPQAVSKCCLAPIKLGGIGDFSAGDKKITLYYQCTKCGKACDSIIVPRRTWKKNPSTQIQKDKRNQIKKKIIDKEIKEIE